MWHQAPLFQNITSFSVHFNKTYNIFHPFNVTMLNLFRFVWNSEPKQA